MHGHLHQPDWQRERRVEDPGQPAAAAAEHHACQEPRGDRTEQTEGQSRRAGGRLGEAEGPQRPGQRPEEEDRFVGKGLPEKSRRHVVATLDHLLRDRGVQAFVGIDERMLEDERTQEERGPEHGERGHEPAIEGTSRGHEIKEGHGPGDSMMFTGSSGDQGVRSIIRSESAEMVSSSVHRELEIRAHAMAHGAREPKSAASISSSVLLTSL